jgi:predicted MPP superfamily phosphohydrolase
LKTRKQTTANSQKVLDNANSLALPTKMEVVWHSIHFFPGLCLLLLGIALLALTLRLLPEQFARRPAIRIVAAASAVLLALGYLLEYHAVIRLFPVWWSTWLECAAIVETVCLIGVYVGVFFWRSVPQFQPGRRRFGRTIGTSLAVLPLAGACFGIVRRNDFQLSEVNIPIPNLPRDLDGLKIVQITDVHLSPFLSEREFARAVDMANETHAHLALMTGDLISRLGDPLDACLRQLARLRADAGVLGCLGNHEVYTKTEDYVAAEGRKVGIEFLRGQSKVLRFGSAAINFAGIDYQKFQSPYLVGAERLIAPGAINVLLSHNPDVFPVAAQKGFDLTIAGHTHGGQVNFEILHQHVNVARYFTPYVWGLYRESKSSVYVSSGVGTVGVPIRLGATPEISLIRLCAT